MQHTLIPLKDRQRLHREYLMRVATVSFFVLAVAVIVGDIALFPAYNRGKFYNDIAQNAVDAAAAKKAGASVDKIKNELLSDNKLLVALAENNVEPRFSETVRSLTSVLGTVTLSSMNISKTGDKVLTIAIKGTAPTRNELLAFKGRLEVLMPGTRVEIPIDQLSRNLYPTFNLSFTKNLP